MQDQLIRGEEFYKKKESLKKINVDNTKWIVYYLDETNGEKWIEEYPFSEMHGGGPPQFRRLNCFPWEENKG